MRSSAAAQRTERRAIESLNSRVVMALILLLLLACINYAKLQESRKYTRDLSQNFFYQQFRAECMYQYLEQPPLDIICDPHNPQSTGLSLQCQVLALGPSSSYNVGWFYYPTNHDGATPPTPISVTSTIRDNISSATSTTTVTLTLRPFVDGSSPGFYYCQVLPVDQSETIPSDNFTLYAPEDNHYLTFIICESNKPRFKSEVKCAVPMGDDPVNITGIQPPQNVGDPIDLTTGNVIITTTDTPNQGDQPIETANNSAIVTSLPMTEVINNSTIVTCTERGPNIAMLYQIYVYVLTPIFLVILIVLITTVAVCLGRKCVRRSEEQQKKAEENRTRGTYMKFSIICDAFSLSPPSSLSLSLCLSLSLSLSLSPFLLDGQAGLGGLNQLRQSFHRVLRSQQRPTPHNNSPLSSLDLQPNPSYLENSRNTTLLQSKTCRASPLLETQRQIQKPDPCRQDITRQEDVFSNGGSIVSYEDNSYIIMRSSGTNSTYQSSGAYESML